MIDLTENRIFVAGSETLIGEALARRIRGEYPAALIDASIDLTEKGAVDDFFRNQKPDFVIYAGGRSGGISANVKYPADLMLNNLYSSTNVINACHSFGVKKLLFLASSCSYPRLCSQPMSEDQLLTGALEPTNEAYAVAKIAGIKLCQAFRRQYGDDFIVGIPANSFGIHDDFSPEDSHVIGALMSRAHDAKLKNNSALNVWGTGNARREFLFADDIADACIFLMKNYSDEDPINLAGGTDISIGELARLICDVVGYNGELVFDTTKPDGMPLKALNHDKLTGLGWCPKSDFKNAMHLTYNAFLTTQQQGKRHA